MKLVEQVPGDQSTQADGRVPAMADYVDRLVTVEMRNRGMPGGKIAPLYEAARSESGGEPLAFRAAAGLLARTRRHDNVLIVTGAGSGPLIPNGENDGPVGAAVLASALHRGAGCTPILVCEQHHAAPIVAACEAIGVGMRSVEQATGSRVGGALVTSPTRQDEVVDWSRDLLDRLQPSAIVAIERLGPNSKGIVHGATGLSGCVQPHGAACQCECGAGMATVVPTDVLVVAAVSNWGAYAIEACIAMLLERTDLQHTPQEAERVILRCLEAGGLEAMFCTQRFFVDGIAGEVSVSIVQLLREMVRIYLEVPDTGVIH